jgi:hypothetical protein
MRKLLSAQEAARQSAQATVLDVHRELKLSETENNRMRIELKRTQSSLTNIKQGHSIELSQAAARESRLSGELLEVRAVAAKALESVSGYRKKLLVSSMSFVVPVLLWIGVSYYHRTPAAPDSPQTEASVAAAPAPPIRPAKPAASRAASPAASPAKKVAPDFTGSVGRLDQALEKFKGVKPEDVLRGVRLANAARGQSVCSFEWNNGQVSLTFGPKPEADIGTAVSNCADAVERAAK